MPLKEQPQIIDGPRKKHPKSLGLRFENVTSPSRNWNYCPVCNKFNHTWGQHQTGAVGSENSHCSIWWVVCTTPQQVPFISGITPWRIPQHASFAWVCPTKSLFIFRDIEENIQFKPKASFKKLLPPRRTPVAKNIEGFENTHPAGERGVIFEGKYNGRHCPCRERPWYSLLDDCLSAVDTDTEENLKNLTPAKKQTTLIISHRISSVLDADSIIVLDNGKIIQQGTHKSLIKTPLLQRSFPKTTVRQEN